MHYKNCIRGIFFIIPFLSLAQVGIGTSNPDASAILDVTSTNKGFLPPRMTETQRGAINGAVEGLVVFCTDCCTDGRLSFYNGTAWNNIPGCSQSTNLGPLEDRDGDGIPNNVDIDDDNDGILDAEEYQTIVLNQATTIPTGNGNPYGGASLDSLNSYTGYRGLRISDASGQYALDIVDLYQDDANASVPASFTLLGQIKDYSGNALKNGPRAYAVLLFTTQYSPTPWKFDELNISAINSLSSHSATKDAYSFENATLSNIPTPGRDAAIFYIDPNNSNKIGNVKDFDQDYSTNPADYQPSDIGSQASFSTAYSNSGNSLKEVLLNMANSSSNHSLKVSFDSLNTQTKLHLWDAAQANSMGWIFEAATSTSTPQDFDNDGIPNHLDTDSDGDGCSDAYEAGLAGAQGNPNFAYDVNNVGTNGFINTLETNDNGIPTYGALNLSTAVYNSSNTTCP